MSTQPMPTCLAHALARTSTSVLLVLAVVLPASAQIPDTFTNLQVLPEDISRDSLIQIMRGFSFALGVRCQYCHVGGDGISFEGVEFDKDDDEDKRKARFMLRMVENLNRYVLPLTPERDTPTVMIECKTCHRGLPRPLLLKQDLLLVTHEAGVDSAAQRYRQLREEFALSGSYDFGEWETNQVAEQLEAEGRNGDAIAIYELNSEFYPASVSIAANLARLYESEGDQSAAIRYYERVLELRPGHRGAQDRLEALRGQ
jgi:hypothetical protein